MIPNLDGDGALDRDPSLATPFLEVGAVGRDDARIAEAAMPNSEIDCQFDAAQASASAVAWRSGSSQNRRRWDEAGGGLTQPSGRSVAFSRREASSMISAANRRAKCAIVSPACCAAISRLRAQYFRIAPAAPRSMRWRGNISCRSEPILNTAAATAWRNLSANEGPARISKLGATRLKRGMVLSNGLIPSGEHLTWFNDYHARVRHEIRPHVDEAMRVSMDAATAPQSL